MADKGKQQRTIFSLKRKIELLEKLEAGEGGWGRKGAGGGGKEEEEKGCGKI